MDENQPNSNKLLDTTDCLEAVGVFRGWKNALFVLLLLCLLFLQGSFWLVNTGYVKTTKTTAVLEDAKKGGETQQQQLKKEEQIKEASEKVVADANRQAEEQTPAKQRTIPFKLEIEVKFSQLAQLIRLINFVLILAAVLYCLTLLFSLKVSMLGKLGGINHISRAFFISLVFLVLVLPWQRFFAGVIAGAIYMPAELSTSHTAVKNTDIFGEAFYYLRFVGYWLLVLALLICAQMRSRNWTKATLRRLEVI
ncbi:MAG: hypothetical protein ACYSYU_04090 [Planctomycetota bacterium]|jgi:hypothetical protein